MATFKPNGRKLGVIMGRLDKLKFGFLNLTLREISIFLETNAKKDRLIFWAAVAIKNDLMVFRHLKRCLLEKEL